MVKLTPDLIHKSMQYTNPVKDRELDLRGLKIPVIENLGATLDQFDTIDFSDNDIHKLGGFPLLKRLKHLLLNNNRIVRITEGLEECLPNLESIILTGNLIQELSDIDVLVKLPRLQNLSLLYNPVQSKPHYRQYIAFKLPQLKVLDFNKIKKKERDEAIALFRSKKGKELQKEISKPKTFVPGAGLPTPKTGPSQEDLWKIRKAVSKATTLEEIERLNKLLQQGGAGRQLDEEPEMDWFTLTSEVLAKKKQEETEEGEALSKTSTDETLEGFEKVEGRLSPLEAAVVSCALEIAWLQLRILDAGTCSSCPNQSNVIARKKIIDVIKETWEEIETKGTFDVLYEKTKEEAEKRRSDRMLKKSVIHNQYRIEDLKSKLKGQEFMKLREMNKKQEIIASLKDKTHEEITKTDVKLRYVDRWEAARQNQNRLKCQNAEAEWEKKLEEITNKCANEIRVHNELCTFLALEEQALLENQEKWKNLYESEMKRRNEKLKMLETRRKEQQILHHDLLELYEERQREINDYLNFKERLRKEQEHERFLNKMATKIQAWWRGTMVRRGLGSFKRKKKLVKDKKKK